MRFIEVLKVIRNKIIRWSANRQPEGNQKVPDTPDGTERVTESTKENISEEERLIRRYRAYAYHHKKKRIRKKYLKKLLEISAVDRLGYAMSKIGVTAEAAAFSLRTLVNHGNVGGVGEDHPDSR